MTIEETERVDYAALALQIARRQINAAFEPERIRALATELNSGVIVMEPSFALTSITSVQHIISGEPISEASRAVFWVGGEHRGRFAKVHRGVPTPKEITEAPKAPKNFKVTERGLAGFSVANFDLDAWQDLVRMEWEGTESGYLPFLHSIGIEHVLYTWEYLTQERLKGLIMEGFGFSRSKPLQTKFFNPKA